TSKLEQEILDQLRGFEQASSAELAAQVLDVFLQDTGNRLAALRRALDGRDGEAAYQAAHTMQGSASMVGVTSMAESCRELAGAARGGSFDRCEALAAEVGAELRQGPA